MWLQITETNSGSLQQKRNAGCSVVAHRMDRTEGEPGWKIEQDPQEVKGGGRTQPDPAAAGGPEGDCSLDASGRCS